MTKDLQHGLQVLEEILRPGCAGPQDDAIAAMVPGVLGISDHSIKAAEFTRMSRGPDSATALTTVLGALAHIPYQHVVRSNEAEAGHPQISQIQPVNIDGLAIRAPENLRNLRNLRISLPVFLLPRRA